MPGLRCLLSALACLTWTLALGQSASAAGRAELGPSGPTVEQEPCSDLGSASWMPPADAPDLLKHRLASDWPEAPAVYLLQQQSLHIELDSLADGRIDTAIYKKHRYLLYLGREAFRHFGEQSVGQSDFRTIEDLQACTWVPQSDGYRRLPVESFGRRKRHTAGIFHDDLEERFWTFSGLVPHAVVEWRYTERTLEPRFIGSLGMGASYPVLEAEMQVQADPAVRLNIGLLGTDTALVQKQRALANGRQQWCFRRTHIPSLDREPGGPPWQSLRTEVLPVVQSIGQQALLDGVEGLYAWYRHLTKAQDRRMAQDPAIQRLADSLTKGPMDEREKAKRIFHWVQSEIRYIAFEEGLGGFIPRDPGQVCRQRYGDCKDMASLCVALLRACGLEAERVWLGTRDLPYRYESVPTPMADNHMVAALRLPSSGASWVYLDATDAYLPFGYPSQFIQGRPALIGRGDAFELDTVPIPGADQNRSLLDLELRMEGLELQGEGRIRLTGYPAMAWRKAMAERKPDGRKRWVEDRLALGSNRFEIRSLEQEGLALLDDTFRLHFAFRIPEQTSFAAGEYYLNPHLWQKISQRLLELPRTQDRHFAHRWSSALSCRFRAPQGWTWRYAPQGYQASDGHLSTVLDYSVQNDDFLFHMKLEQGHLHLPAYGAESWNAFWNGLLTKQRQSLVLSPKAQDESWQTPSYSQDTLKAQSSGVPSSTGNSTRQAWGELEPNRLQAHALDLLLQQGFADPIMDSLWLLPCWMPRANPNSKVLLQPALAQSSAVQASHAEAADDHAAVVLLDRRWISFEWYKGQLVQLERVQTAVRVQSAKGVERFNKIFLPQAHDDALLGFHAYLRSPEGQIRKAASIQDVLEVGASAEHDRFRQCAVQGMRIGDVLVYGYVRRKAVPFFGRFSVQRNIPVQHVDLRLEWPAAAMDIACASYHGLPEAKPGWSSGLIGNGQASRRSLRLECGPLEPAYKARYAPYEAFLQRLDWRLKALPLYGMDQQSLSWRGAAERMVEALDLRGAGTNAEDSLAIAALLTELFGAEPLPQQTPGSPSRHSLFVLEQGLKERIGVLPNAAPSDGSLEAMLRQRQAGKAGMLRLFAACFRQLGWRFELVMGASEDAPDLDTAFAQWQALQEFYLFLPDLQQYLAPGQWAYRNGLLPPAWCARPALHAALAPGSQDATAFDADTAGLDASARSLEGDALRPMLWTLEACRWDTVAELPLEGQYEDLDVDMVLVPASGKTPRHLEAEVTRRFTGLRAAYIRPFLPLMDAEERAALFKELLALGMGKEAVYAASQSNGSAWDAFQGKAWRVDGRLRMHSLLAPAGERLRINIGACIGPQVALYQQRPRQFPIDADHPHGYRRFLKLAIPEGHRLLGIEDLNMDRVLRSPEGDTLMAFISYARMGQTPFGRQVLEVRVHEFYRNTRYPVRYDTAFRRVINAAADFNKRSVVLVPE